jgi:ABC-type ATPase involved in cell division
LLQTINSWGTTVIMSTHDLNLIEPYHYRRLVLSSGSLISGGDASVKPKFSGGLP